MKASLASRGVTGSAADDLCQDVAERVVLHRPPFRDADDLLPWALRVARNCEVSAYRRTSRIDLREAPDSAVPVSLEQHAEARRHLAAVLGALPRMKEVDQEAIQTALNGTMNTGTKRERDRLSLQLFRARKRLSAMVEAALGVILWLRARGRSEVVLLPTVALAVVTTILVPRFVERDAERGDSEYSPTRDVGHLSATTPAGDRYTADDIERSLPRTSPTADGASAEPVDVLVVPSPTGRAPSRVSLDDEDPDGEPLACYGGPIGAGCTPPLPEPDLIQALTDRP